MGEVLPPLAFLRKYLLVPMESKSTGHAPSNGFFIPVAASPLRLRVNLIKAFDCGDRGPVVESPMCLFVGTVYRGLLAAYYEGRASDLLACVR